MVHDENMSRARAAISLALVATTFLLAAGCSDDGEGTTSSSAPPDTAAIGDAEPADETDEGAGGGAEQGSEGEISTDFADLPVLDDVTVPEWEPTTRTEELALEIERDGVTLQHAIDAFSLLYAEMPGATEFDLPAGDGLGATSTLSMIESVRDQLAPEQRAVLEALDDDVEESGALDGTTGAPTSLPDADNEIGGKGNGGRNSDRNATPTSISDRIQPLRGNAAPGAVGTVGAIGALLAPTTRAPRTYAQLQRLLTGVVQDWLAHRPDFPMPAGFTLAVMRTGVGSRGADMDAFPDPDRQGWCRIRVYPKLLTSGADDVTITTAFAHEVFHCVQFEWKGSTNLNLPDWVVEGSASFASFDLSRGSHAPPSRYAAATWWRAAGGPLSARSYGAWPLYESYRQAGGDAYAAIRELFLFGSGTSAGDLLRLSHLAELSFLTSWSSLSLRSTQFPEREWLMDWPGPSATAGPRDNVVSAGTRGIGTYVVHGSPRWSHRQSVVTMARDVGIVTVVSAIGPMSTHTATGSSTIPQLTPFRFCFDAGGCRCPDGSRVGTKMAGRDMVFSFAADEQAPTAAVGAEKWNPKKYCKEDKRKRASSNGDPHLVSFDGRPFDVMALGEFVTAQDPDGDFEVQARHEPFDFGMTGISAVAIGTGAHRITLTASELTADASIEIRVDGELVTSGRGEDVPSIEPLELDGVTFAHDPSVEAIGLGISRGAWVASWPDGTTVGARWSGGWFLTVQAPPERASRLVGLLGSSNGDFRDDLALPNGTIIPVPTQESIDLRFAPAWQVDDDTTLFDYADGQSVEGFVGPPPPPPEPVSDDVLEACAGALGDRAADHEVDSCAYDVNATGDEGYIDAYTSEVDARSSANPDPFVVADDVPNPDGNGTDPATGRAGEPTLTLSGRLYDGLSFTDDDEAADYLVGSIEVAEGSVVVMRAELCPADVDVTVKVRLRGSDVHAPNVFVCDTHGFTDGGTEGQDEMVDDETYVWASAAGTYDLAVQTSSPDPINVSVSFFTDASPTILDPDEALVDGVTTTLSGTGDTLVLILQTDTSLDFTSDGLDQACNRYVYGADRLGEGGAHDLGFCGHAPSLGMSPTGELQVPFVVFLRSDDPADVRIGPGTES